MKNKKLFISIAIISFVAYIASNIVYFYKFNGSLSSNPEVWGQYGDFIGGLVNPFLAFINIIALFLLTFTVSDIEKERAKEAHLIEEKRAEEQMNVQKIITINQMRFDAVKELSKSLYTATTIIEKAKKPVHIVAVEAYLNSFYLNSYHLFENLHKEKSFKEAYEILKTATKKLREYIREKGEGAKIDNEGNDLFNTYESARTVLLQRYNKFIIDELSPMKTI